MAVLEFAPGTGKPPTDIPPDDLYVRLSAAVRPTELVDFPRKDANGSPLGQIAMRVLTQGEIIIAKSEATRRARKMVAEKFEASERIEGYAQVLEDECACQILFQACRRPTDVSLPTFPTADKVRTLLSSDEVSVLLNSYAIVQTRLGPLPDSMGKAEYEAWISRLKEGGSALPLALVSPGQLRDLLTYTIDQLVNLRADKSSAGPLTENDTSTA